MFCNCTVVLSSVQKYSLYNLCVLQCCWLGCVQYTQCIRIMKCTLTLCFVTVFCYNAMPCTGCRCYYFEQFSRLNYFAIAIPQWMNIANVRLTNYITSLAIHFTVRDKCFATVQLYLVLYRSTACTICAYCSAAGSGVYSTLSAFASWNAL